MCVYKRHNARPHTALIIETWLNHQNVTLIKQPPYSPDYNLMDSFRFRNYEVFRREKTFTNSQEVEQSIVEFMNSLTARKLGNEFNKLRNHLQNVIQTKQDYI